MATLTVGPGMEFATIAAAISASVSGDFVDVAAGTYVNDFATINDDITLQGIGGMVTLDATAAPPNGKAILTTDADVTISHFAFTGATVAAGNGAGIRDELGALTLEADDVYDNQEGLLADATAGNLTIRSSEFGFNGAGDGQTHNIYVGTLGTFTLMDSYIHDAVGGDEVKSRAATADIIDDRIVDGSIETDGAYDIDLSQGGSVVVAGNVIEKGANEPDHNMISFASEVGPTTTLNANSTLSVSGNTFVNDDTKAYIVYNADAQPITINDDAVWNIPPADYVSGTTVAATNITTLASEPAISTVAPYTLPIEIDATAGRPNAVAGGTINPFASDSFTVTYDGIVSATIATGGQGVLTYGGQDGHITVTSDGATLVVTGLASRIIAGALSGDFQYAVNAGFAGDTVTLTVPDPDVFLVTVPHDAAAVATTFATPIAVAACYVAGTRIATADGERVIETLAVGDAVMTATGVARRIRWIGVRSYEAELVARSPHLQPIRVAAGAIADGVPRRDLLVSARHGLYFDGVLIPAEALVDGIAIRRDATPRDVTYLHVELDRHDVLLAEGVRAESFCDCGNRGMFHQTRGPAVPPPGAALWSFCAPVVESGPKLARVRADLAARTAAFISDAGGLVIETADGRLVRTRYADGCFVVELSDVGASLRLRSPSAVPNEIGLSADARRLGIGVRRLTITRDGEPIVLDPGAVAFAPGFHAAEPALQWTDGDGHVDLSDFAPLTGACRVRVDAFVLPRYLRAAGGLAHG